MRFARDRSTMPTTYACFIEECKNGRSLHGDWSFIDHKNKISMGFEGFPSGPWNVAFGPMKEYYATEWEILKLTNNAFWFIIQYNDKQYNFKYKKIK